MKRNNSYPDNDPKKRKIENSFNQSAVGKDSFFPIASLRPILKCPRIKGTLTLVTNWIHGRGTVKFLEFRLKDESGEIRGLAFQPMPIDFEKDFKIGTTFILSHCQVQIRKGANQINGLESYQLIINRKSHIKQENVPLLKPTRKMIKDVLDGSNKGDIVDVLAIVENVGELGGNSIREIRIVDESKANIILTLWDNAARKFDAPLGSVIKVDHAAVRIFNSSKVLRSCYLTKLVFDPPTDETLRLKQWYEEWTAVNNTCEIKNSTLIANTVKQIDDGIIENRKTKIVDSFASTSTWIPQANYASIKTALESRAGTVLNIVGFVSSENPPMQQLTKSGDLKWMKTIILADEDNCEIEMAIWGDDVKTRNIPLNSNIIAKNVTVRDFKNDKTLTCLWVNLQINSNVPQPAWLKQRISNNSPANGMENSVIPARSSGCPSTSLNIGNITPLKEIKNMETSESNYDILALVTECKLPEQRLTKRGLLSWMRIVIVMDDEDSEIEMTIWGSDCKNEIPLNSVIMARKVLVRDFDNDKKLSCLWSNLHINPDVPQAARLINLIAISSKTNEAEVFAGPSGIKRNSGSLEKFSVQRIQFTPIRDIESKETTKTTWNIIGIVIEVQSMERLMTKKGNYTYQRVVIVLDESNSKIELMVSGEELMDHKIPLHCVMIAQNIAIHQSDDDKTLNCLWKDLIFNPDIPKTDELLKWYDRKKEIEKVRELPIIPINLVLENCADDTRASIMGIIISSEMHEIEESGKRFETRIIQIIDDSEEVINLLLWNFASKDFVVPLHSIIKVSNFHVYTEGKTKWGDFGPGTEYKVITADGKYLEATKRLKSWFAKYCGNKQNLTDSGSSNGYKNSIPLFDSTKVKAQNPTILSDYIELVESPTGLPNDIIKMMKSSTVLSDNIEMTESSQEIGKNPRIFIENDCCLDHKNERGVDTSNGNDVIEYDSDSPDIFADC